LPSGNFSSIIRHTSSGDPVGPAAGDRTPMARADGIGRFA
jgi:hypothetical protein